MDLRMHETISSLLGEDHDRLDARLMAARQAWADADLLKAGELFGSFAAGLRRHIRAEEDVLFPTFEANAGMGAHEGPTAVMRMEHEEIEQALVEIQAALAVAQSREPRAMGDMFRLLEAHNRKEEHILYPMIDRSLEGPARISLCKTVAGICLG